MLPAHATDNMKAFLPADQGMVRYVLQLPTNSIGLGLAGVL